MSSIEELEAERERIFEQLRAMRSLERGSINEQYLKGSVQGQREPVLRGPYFVLSRYEGGRTLSRRLKTPEEVQGAREDVARHQRFVQLCKQLEELTQRLGELERGPGEGQEKKNDPSDGRTGSGGEVDRKPGGFRLGG